MFTYQFKFQFLPYTHVNQAQAYPDPTPIAHFDDSGLEAVNLLLIPQNNCYNKNLLGNKQRIAVDRIKHCEKQLPLKERSFRERSNFPQIETSEFDFEVPKSSI